MPDKKANNINAKIYYEKNKDMIKMKQREYYEKNKELIRKKNLQRYYDNKNIIKVETQFDIEIDDIDENIIVANINEPGKKKKNI